MEQAAQDYRVIARGAEAVLTRTLWHSRPVVMKERISKAYRSPELDRRLRQSRTKSEALLMSQARAAGVCAPLIFDIDMERCVITMEFLAGETAKKLLQDSPDRMRLAFEIGWRVGLLHGVDIVHGDLTTSNMIFRSGEPCFIDFGLGERTKELEKKGVDIHLLKEALSSAHSEHEGLFESVASGYVAAYPGGAEILSLVEEIEGRGRYA